MKPKQREYEVKQSLYGFIWGECLVERTCSNTTKPKFQVITVYAPNGEGVEIVMTPRTLKTKRFKRAKE